MMAAWFSECSLIFKVLFRRLELTSSKLEAETFKLGWMAGWEHSEDKEILNCTPGQSEERKVYC